MKQIYILSLLFTLSFSQLKAQTTITFNGTDNKVSVPKNGSGVMNDFTTPHDFTIEIRFKFNSTPSGTIFSKHSPPADGFFIEMSGANIHSGMGYNGNYTTITGSSLSANQYYHAALSYEVSSNSFKLYLDGALVNTQTISSSYVPNVDDNISIGSSDHWGGHNDLTLDYFRIWDIQRSDADINNNKDIEVSCSSGNLLLQYQFDNTIPLEDGDSVNSCTSNNHGTFFGSTQTLSTAQFNKLKTIKIFPNPSSQFIEISGLITSQVYTIYNTLGAEIKKGIISNNNQIDIRDFTDGLYFLKFENGNMIKFIKE